jgi:hypothetical protein
LLLALGILAVLFVVVFSVAGLAANANVQTSLYINKRIISMESESFCAKVLSEIKANKTPNLQITSPTNPEIYFKAELKNSSPDNSIYSKNGIQFKDGDSLLNIRTAHKKAELYIDSVYLVNPIRSTYILLSEKIASVKGE